jgi:hypothetical protein
VVLVAVILGVYVGAEVSYGAYVLVYAHQRLEIEEGEGQYMTAVFWGSLALGRLAAIVVAQRLSPTRMLWVVFCGCAVCTLALVALPSVRVLWAASAALGALMAPTFPTLYTLAGSFNPVSGRVATVFVIGASAGVRRAARPHRHASPLSPTPNQNAHTPPGAHSAYTHRPFDGLRGGAIVSSRHLLLRRRQPLPVRRKQTLTRL